ncbi:hypothetical protein B9479_002926 [Cryptococcus floricola]|uniref:GATA-type domain-containing protein n=1 Tax=Cryptococcus floricola TaxID=2591691 RepID=A0A5D3AZY9_9TREE|nr:hypothetical protein B9479_002926 [Cryptococcus floricola]
MVFPSSGLASPPLRAVTPQDSITKSPPPPSEPTRTDPPSTRKRAANINRGSRFAPRTPTNNRQCTNCGETDTPQWRGEYTPPTSAKSHGSDTGTHRIMSPRMAAFMAQAQAQAHAQAHAQTRPGYHANFYGIREGTGQEGYAPARHPEAQKPTHGSQPYKQRSQRPSPTFHPYAPSSQHQSHAFCPRRIGQPPISPSSPPSLVSSKEDFMRGAEWLYDMITRAAGMLERVEDEYLREEDLGMNRPGDERGRR